MIVISRFTSNYFEVAKALEQSCYNFGIASEIVRIPDGEDWFKQCAKVPNFILDAVIRWRQPICWMDADCEVMKSPDMLLNATADFAVYNWHADPQTGQPPNPDRLLSSGGVLYFSYTAPSLDLLFRWASQMHLETSPRPCDQVLDDVYNSARVPLRTLWLPRTYNRMDCKWPNLDPVINHKYMDGARSRAGTDSHP